MQGGGEGLSELLPDSALADTPLRRFGRADEVAALAVLLASDEAAFTTGTIGWSRLVREAGVLLISRISMLS